MVSSQRIKTYDFPTFIQATNAGEVLGSTTHVINGELIKARWDNVNTAAAGSMFIYEGVSTAILQGSIVATNADKDVYFGVDAQKGTGGTLPVVNDILLISGMGFGVGSSGTLRIYYR